MTDERETPAVSASDDPEQPPVAEEIDDRRGVPAWLKAGIVFGLLTAGVAFLLFGSSETSDAFAYSKLVDEVMADPAAFTDRELRVEGELKPGSILFREEPSCEWRFVLRKSGREMAVRFPQCVVPDTFRDGMGISVTVQGRIDTEGSFLANQVIPRCPSKYEMQQMQQNGQTIPHSMPAAGDRG